MSGKLNILYKTSMAALDRKVLPILPKKLHAMYNGQIGIIFN